MTWRLKDRWLEKKLIEIAPDFVESLNESLKLGEYEENSWTYRVWFGPYEDCYKFEMHVYDDELEEVPEYNPKTWNSYPEVIPPENVLMRVECDGNMHTALIYKGNRWQFESGEDFLGFESIYKVKRFRPWED